MRDPVLREIISRLFLTFQLSPFIYSSARTGKNERWALGRSPTALARHQPQPELGGGPPGRENQMKLVKLTLLAATAAIAAMAFIGASSASATPPWIAVCGKAQLLNCENQWLVKHPLLGRLIALVGPGKFNAGFVTVECESGEGHSNEIESQQSGEVKGKLEALTFAGCKGCTGVKVEPVAVALNMETETGGWRVKANGGKVQFTGCPLSQTCTYEGNLNLEVQMNETEAFVEPKGTEFKKVEPSTSLCAATGKWETGKTLFDWELNDKAFPNGTRHKDVFPSLIGKELIKKVNELGIVG
jgi:hypothetical protein